MADTQKTPSTPNQVAAPSPNQIDIHFLKSSQFRVIHADGAWFGGDPQGSIHLTFYNDRSPIPQKIVANLNERGNLLAEDVSQRESKHGIVREVEVDIVMSMTAAIQMYAALDANLKNMQAMVDKSIPESVKKAVKEAMGI